MKPRDIGLSKEDFNYLQSVYNMLDRLADKIDPKRTFKKPESFKLDQAQKALGYFLRTYS